MSDGHDASFVRDDHSTITGQGRRPQCSTPQAVQKLVLTPSLRFDVDGAYDQVRAQAYISDMRIYRPYLAAQSFGDMLPLKYANIHKFVYTDPEGVKWKPVSKWQEEIVDLGSFWQTSQEEEFIRCLTWQLKLGGSKRFEAAKQVIDNGWLKTDSYKYVCLLEEGNDDLKSLMSGHEMRAKSPDHRGILVSRCLVTVLDTLEHLHESFGMILTNLCLENLFLRPDWKSGFLSKFDVQQAHPMIVSTESYPYYASNEELQ